MHIVYKPVWKCMKIWYIIVIFKRNEKQISTKIIYYFCLPSRKLYRLDEPDTLDTAGEARTSS